MRVTSSPSGSAAEPAGRTVHDRRRSCRYGYMTKVSSIDHRHDRVEVHHRVRVGQFDGDDPVGRAVGEQAAGQVLHAHRGAALAEPDHHRAVAEDVDVAALERGRLVVLVVAAVPDRSNSALGEHRVEPVDRRAVHGLPHPGRHRHRVDAHPVVDPGRVVALEQVVRQRGEHEVVEVHQFPAQAVDDEAGQVALEYAADEELGQPLGVGLVGQPPQRFDQRRPDGVLVDDPLQDPGPGGSGSRSVSASSCAEVVHGRPRGRAATWAKASCSSRARLAHRMSSKSRLSTLVGVSRLSSSPGRCRITCRSRPISEST